jgi:protoporphyrinogen oxidase
MDGLEDALLATIGTDAIRTETRAVELARAAASGSRESVSVTVAGPDGRRTCEVDGVVLATAPEPLETLTGLETGIETVAASSVLVAADDPLTDAWRVTAADDAPFDRVVEHTNLCSPERYDGAHLCYVVDHAGSTADAADHDRLLEGLDACFASFSRDSVRWVRTARDPAAAVVAPAGDAVPVSLADAGYPAVAYAGPGSRADRFGTSPSARIAAGIAAAEDVAADATGGVDRG